MRLLLALAWPYVTMGDVAAMLITRSWIAYVVAVVLFAAALAVYEVPEN
jgi:hypothetical protein